MSSNIKDMGSIGVFTKGFADMDIAVFKLNHDGFPLDYVKDVLGAVSRYVKCAKASGYSALVEFNMAMYRPDSPMLKDAQVRLAVSEVVGDGCMCHSVAYFEVDGVSKCIHSVAFKLEDVVTYLESVECTKAA